MFIANLIYMLVTKFVDMIVHIGMFVTDLVLTGKQKNVCHRLIQRCWCRLCSSPSHTSTKMKLRILFLVLTEIRSEPQVASHVERPSAKKIEWQK